MAKALFKLLMMSLIIFTACKKQNIKNAEKSLQGGWKVHAIHSMYGNQTELGIQSTHSFEDKGELGEFVFNDKLLTYTFTRLDTLYENETTWNLTREKINAGFTKAEQYTLSVNEYNFICAYGDGTKDAEKNATELALFFETDAIGKYQAFELKLTKNR